jgi:sugar-specific transcriptional regulator TrmB
MEETKILEDLGFSKSEAIVYLTLLKIGKTKSGEIIKKTGLQSSVIHNTLNTLIDKGFITYVLEGKIKQYEAVSPKLIREWIKSKEKSFEDIMPKLQNFENQSKEKGTKTKVYEGFKGLLTATLEIIGDSNKGDYKYFAAEKILLDKKAIEFFEKVDLIKKDKKISVKGIAKMSGKEVLNNYKNSLIRYTKEEIPPAMNIYGDKVLIISLSEKPIGILIDSKEIAKQYHDLWNNIWKKSKE